MEDDSRDGGIFDYDDEVSMFEAAKDEGEEDEVTWRLDPEASLSDWTVITTNKLFIRISSQWDLESATSS
jgi:hypothetical protein